MRIERKRIAALERAIDEFEGDASCAECGRPIGESDRWYSDGVGGLVPYCKACAEIEFPVI